MLHPSFKRFQIAFNERQKAIDIVKAEISKRRSSATSESPVIEITSLIKSSTKSMPSQLKVTTAIQNILAQCFDSPLEDKDPLAVLSPEQELMEYIASGDMLQLDDDVLLFWKNNQNKFSILSSVVRGLYSIPASNTSVERHFSSTGNTVSDRRTNLNPDKVNKGLFLNKNLLLLKRTRSSTISKYRKKKEKHVQCQHRHLHHHTTLTPMMNENNYRQRHQVPKRFELSTSICTAMKMFLAKTVIYFLGTMIKKVKMKC